LIIPLGHEQTSVRRLPWVTFTIIGLCIVAFVLSIAPQERSLEEANRLLQEIGTLFFTNPDLDLDPEIDEMFFGSIRDDQGQREAFREALKGMVPQAESLLPPELRDSAARERLQAELQGRMDRLSDQFWAALHDVPNFKWGLVPAHKTVHGFVTHMFMHAGWLHLIGNLLFLFLAGPFIEDVWGRPLFAAFYLGSGLVAAFAYAARYPGLEGPLIGASGAIAGVMGAFLIRYWNTKIRFFYWIFFFVGTFEAAAWIMLPLWFLRELFSANVMDVLIPGEGGGGVAYWAHVWGFGFGMVMAVAISYFRVEDRFIHRAIESKITVVDNTSIEQAMELAATGDSQGAVEALGRELRVRPENVDAAMAFWNLTLQAGNVAPAVPHMLRAVRRAARDGDSEFVTGHWEEMMRACPDLEVDPALGVRMAEMLALESRDGAALDTLEIAQRFVDSSTPVGIIVRMARLAVEIESPSAETLIETAVAHPEVPDEARSELEGKLAALPSHPEGTSNTEQDSVEVGGEYGDEERQVEAPAEKRSLQAMAAIPRSLDGDTLIIEVDGVERNMGLAQVQALGVGGISRQDRRPVVVVDLLLDSPWGDRGTLRTVRLTSDTFDPRKLVGGENSLAAFQKFLRHLLDVSEAVPLPDPDAARGDPFRPFASLGDYQREVLGVEEPILNS